MRRRQASIEITPTITITVIENEMAIVSRMTEAAPWFDERHGPLPALLLVLTVVTGLVDAVSYLKLGHLGAAIGALLIFRVGAGAVLALALALLTVNGIAGHRLSSSTQAWTAGG
jgi:hypothetical protein